MPKGIWYDYHTREPLRSNGKFVDLEVDNITIPLFIHGGQIIPTQSFKQTTEEVRNSGLKIVAALDENGNADGEFYWDDGISVGKFEHHFG